MAQGRVGRFLALALVAALATAILPAMASARSQNIVVMSRNLYLGADLAPAIAAPDVPSLLEAAADIYVSVLDNDFDERAELIAAEIDQTSPDLIGLQEVSLWQTGTINDPTPATTIAFDYLDSLLDELHALGFDYTPAVVQPTFDAEVPATVSSGGVPVFMDVRLTQRNVILVRDGVAFTTPQAGYFETNVVYTSLGGIPGNDLVDLRGWTSVDVHVGPGNRPFRFLNTHLESFVPPVRDIQAQELLDGPLDTNLKVVAVGDFNTPPTGPQSGAYHILTAPNNGNLTDTWVAANGADPGFTCCQAADLMNLVDETTARIDLILTRTPAVKAHRVFLTGTVDRTSSGLWASDHFGVVAELSLP